MGSARAVGAEHVAMSGFDSLCDPTAPGRLVDADALWDAVRASSEASRGGVRVAAEPEVCAACEGGGWECYGIGHHGPHFRVCESCGNPEGLPSP